MRLENKVALITGGYGGMGRASARLFANEGATVFVTGRSEERGDELAREINEGAARHISSSSTSPARTSGPQPWPGCVRRPGRCTS